MEFNLKNTLSLGGILLMFACGPSGGNNSDAFKQDLVYLDARQALDSSDVLLKHLNFLADQTEKNGEFEALKARNAAQITSQNAADLKRLLDSVDVHSASIKAWGDYRVQVQTQTDYLTALMRSGTAIINRNSQSFGQWVEQPRALPDSVLTPVSKPAIK